MGIINEILFREKKIQLKEDILNLDNFIIGISQIKKLSSLQTHQIRQLSISNYTENQKILQQIGFQFLKWENVKMDGKIFKKLTYVVVQQLSQQQNWGQRLQIFNQNLNESIKAYKYWQNYFQSGRNCITSIGIFHLSKAKWRKLIKLGLLLNQITFQGIYNLTKGHWTQMKRLFLQNNQIKPIQLLNIVVLNSENLEIIVIDGTQICLLFDRKVLKLIRKAFKNQISFYF